MALLQLKGATKAYPEDKLFTDISLQIQKEDRIGLIGANGSGKSTLLKVLTKEEHLEQGEILESNDLEVGYLAQGLELNLEATLYQEMLTVYQYLFRLEKKINKLEEQMSKANGQELEKIMNHYSKLRQQYEEQEGYQYQSQIRGVLFGLGFEESDFESKLVNFSGGEKTRVALAKLLLQKPALLLLDEPTNHLDLQAREWLEDYLIKYPGALLIVSHDRYFLDRVVNRIWELEKGRFEKYKGDYSFYLEQKEERLLNWQREYQKQQKKIEKMEKYIRQNIAGVDSKQARGRRKQLQRMEKIAPPPQLKEAKIDFQSSKMSGQEVLIGESLTKSYAGAEILTELNFRAYRGEKIALVGPNGSGKSTLLKLISDQEKADAGTIKLGSKVELAYYDQEHKDLDLEASLIEELIQVKSISEGEARDLLARFLFQGDDAFKQVSTLSGGERARLSLAKLTLKEHNCLLLDEPTNHLDIKSREILEEALREYTGTILLISHDRYFMDSLVERVWALEDGQLVAYRGDYSHYRKQYQDSLAAKKQSAKVEEQAAQAPVQAEEEEEKIDLEELEEQIMELEARIAELEEEFNNQELYNEEDRLAELSKEYKNLKKKLAAYYTLWEDAI